jgi:hypothetical protein
MPASDILAELHPVSYENQCIILYNILTAKMSDIILWFTEQYLKLSAYLNKKAPDGSESTISPQP